MPATRACPVLPGMNCIRRLSTCTFCDIHREQTAEYDPAISQEITELPEWKCRVILNEATKRYVEEGTTGDYLVTVIRAAYQAGREAGK